jgi:hypothetical protein
MRAIVRQSVTYAESDGDGTSKRRSLVASQQVQEVAVLASMRIMSYSSGQSKPTSLTVVDFTNLCQVRKYAVSTAARSDGTG